MNSNGKKKKNRLSHKVANRLVIYGPRLAGVDHLAVAGPCTLQLTPTSNKQTRDRP